MTDQGRYAQRGVSAQKEDVHKAVKNVDQGLFPKAFCKIYPDYLSNNQDYGNLIHADGSGTKSILAYLWWKETGDLSCWAGIAQDAIVMNLDDMLCVGAKGPFIFSSILNRNKHLIPGEVIEAIISGSESVFQMLKAYDVDIKFLGGETADVGDLVRTITVDGTMACRMPLSKVINAGNITPGCSIIGLSSSGKAHYEQLENSGIGSNGLTSARHDLLNKSYKEKHPECVDPNTPAELSYSGPFKMQDKSPLSDNHIGSLLLSPTRTYAPVLLEIINQYHEQIQGIIHCTGGGQTKVLHYTDQAHIIKNNLFPAPEIFQLIKEHSGAEWKEMYEVFNMGHRMELYVNSGYENQMIDIAKSHGIDAKVIGKVEKHPGNKLTISGDNFEPLVYGQ